MEAPKTQNWALEPEEKEKFNGPPADFNNA
jgi:hypothetical protein